MTGSGWSGFPRRGAPGRGTAPQSAMTSTSPSDVKAPRHARPFHRPDVAGLLHTGQHPGIRGLQLDDLRPQRGGHRLVTGRHLQPQQTAAAVSRPCPNPHTRSPPRGSHSASNTGRGQASARASADVEVPGAPLPETNAINTCNPPLTRAAPRRWRPCPRSPPGSRSPSGAFPRAGRARPPPTGIGAPTGSAPHLAAGAVVVDDLVPSQTRPEPGTARQRGSRQHPDQPVAANRRRCPAESFRAPPPHHRRRRPPSVPCQGVIDRRAPTAPRSPAPARNPLR